jgi:hypothetical protein
MAMRENSTVRLHVFRIIRLRSGRRHRRGCRELDRLEMLLGQIKAVEAERDALLTPASFGL